MLLEANIRALQSEFAAEEDEVELLLGELALAEQAQTTISEAIAVQRGREPASNGADVVHGEADASRGENDANHRGTP